MAETWRTDADDAVDDDAELAAACILTTDGMLAVANDVALTAADTATKAIE